MFLTKGDNTVVIVWLIVLIGSTETLLMPFGRVLSTTLSHSTVHFLDKRRESIVFDLVHLSELGIFYQVITALICITEAIAPK